MLIRQYHLPVYKIIGNEPLCFPQSLAMVASMAALSCHFHWARPRGENGITKKEYVFGGNYVYEVNHQAYHPRIIIGSLFICIAFTARRMRSVWRQWQ